MSQVSEWVQHPKAEGIIVDVLESCCQKSKKICRLKEDLYNYASSHLFDFLDHVVVSRDPSVEKSLAEAGFKEESAGSAYRVYVHPAAQLPRIVLRDKPALGLAVKVESIAHFLMVQGVCARIEGSLFSSFRRAEAFTDGGVTLWAVERRSGGSIEPIEDQPGSDEKYMRAKEKWLTRARDGDLDEALQLAEELVGVLGRDLAAWLILACEREYWQARNMAGQIQKNRQDSLGLGWANHDHHTFRSSRIYFPKLVRLFEILGFGCRERFYAGKEAGWGAQVMENSGAGLILFLDLDLEPHELEIDFAHETLPEIEKLGTIGLWCKLHGDSIMKAGMHHLEAQFDFEKLKEDLSPLGVSMMDPFSNFSYLKQAFTHGQIWQVDSERVEELLGEGKITQEQAEKFIKYGAVGSHLENLQRKNGYKGFNQKNVSYIIQKTDPRTL